ncbi:MAG TPA: TIGR04222 domain-containing membrane protein [Cyanobacteria bacterium UBA11369]|nr:TIGR04222 domain-containing membrane protein [Cyanobacteria bacterium UBA11371]HBE51446.1 TIGR04222 domain-containing membrane protein [Cyanobacteria bacterium UBA11369]
MNTQQAELYQRLQAFSLDAADASLPFSKRLARDNGWTIEYARRVIDEYKKFMFLAVLAGHPVTPSDQVDQAWHLHLLYTRSYWEEFCPNILQTPMHHGPTQGGIKERRKFDNWYNKTLASYEQFFQQSPPVDIWPPSHIRFGKDIKFVRVNTQENWILPKARLNFLSGFRLISFPLPSPPISLTLKGGATQTKTACAVYNHIGIGFRLSRSAIFILCFLLALTVTSCGSLGRSHTISNLLNLTGPEFLKLYLLLGILSIILANIIRECLRQPDGNSFVSLDVYETAYLKAGKYHTVDTAIASLFQRGYVQPQAQERQLVLTTTLEQIDHPLERTIATAIETDGNIDRVRVSTAVILAVEKIGDRLRQLQLLVNQQQAFISGMFSAIPIFALLALGISKIAVGISRGKPVGYLMFLCFIAAIIGLCYLFGQPHRSLMGDRVLANIRTRIRRKVAVSSTDPQLPLAFALFGAGVLAGSTLADLRQVLIPPATASGGDGGGGGGDGGGGGGGCGGCGGCGG